MDGACWSGEQRLGIAPQNLAAGKPVAANLISQVWFATVQTEKFDTRRMLWAKVNKHGR
jgi:hypothetical protein